MSAVWIARMRTEVCTTSGSRFSSSISRPDSFASATPFSLSGTSCQPVNRFSRFHVLCPWRSSTSRPGALPVAIDLGRDLDDLGELFRLQARPADEAAVTQRQLDVRLDVGRADASAVEDTDLARRAGSDQLAHGATDQAHRLVGVLRVSVLAAADRPHRLVRDDQPRRIVGGAVGQARLDLRGDDLVAAPGVVVVLELTHAYDDAQLVRQRRRRLARDHVVGLAKDHAALGVADDDPLAPTLEHRRGHLAGEGARLLPEAILGAQL